MSKVICKFCSAENDDEHERCFSCNAPLPKSDKLSETDEKSLENFISSTEKTILAAKARADSVTFLLFLLIAALWAVAFFAAYRSFPDERTMTVILGLIMGLVGFIVFGGLIGHFERKAMHKAFNQKVVKTIAEYLKATGYSETDFRYIAGKTLKEKSPLLDFLTEL